MRILVTGSSSQTGSLAVRALAREGYAVRCLVHRDAGLKYLPAEGVQLVRGDLEDPAMLARALQGVDAVAQFAHIRFAAALIPACQRADVRRVIFFSSTRRYTQFDCVSARQVREGEAAIEASALEWTILRPSMIYGSRRDNNIAKLLDYLRRHRLFPLVGGGQNRVQPVFTLDVVAALLAALKRAESVRKAYTLAGPEPITYREMIETIARGLGRPVTFVSVPLGLALLAVRGYEQLVHPPRVTSEQIQRLAEDKAFDIALARRDLGFLPIPFSEGVRRQIAREIDAVWAGTSGAFAENGR